MTPFGGVPWWIILVAVLAGILMLALLVLLLWKVIKHPHAHAESKLATCLRVL